VASKAGERREAAKKKYAEKLAAMEVQKTSQTFLEKQQKTERFTLLRGEQMKRKGGIKTLKSVVVGSVLFDPTIYSGQLKGSKNIDDRFFIVTKHFSWGVHAYQCDITPKPYEVPDGFDGKFTATKRNGEEVLEKYGIDLTWNSQFKSLSSEGFGNDLIFNNMIDPKYL
jgi:hypothetical protein